LFFADTGAVPEEVSPLFVVGSLLALLFVVAVGAAIVSTVRGRWRLAGTLALGAVVLGVLGFVAFLIGGASN